MWLLYFLGGAVSCLVFIGLISLFTDHTNQNMNIKLLEVRISFLEQKMKKYEE